MTSLFDQVIRILTPDLGQNMARVSVKLFLKEAGISSEKMQHKDLAQLVVKLKAGLKVFVGNTRAEMLANQILRLDHDGRKKT